MSDSGHHEELVESCRICLTLTSNELDAFQPGDSPVLDQIAELFGEQLIHIDGGPNAVCDSCRNTLQSAWELKRTFIATRIRMEEEDILVSSEMVVEKEEILKEEYIVEEEVVAIEEEEVDYEPVIEAENEDTNDFQEFLDEEMHPEELSNASNEEEPKDILKESHKPQTKSKKSQPKGNGFVCKNCQECCVSQTELYKHRRQAHPELFTCHLCAKVHPTERELKIHMWSHKPMEERPIKCDLCPMRFWMNCHLQVHINRIHTKAQLFSCEYCGKGFTSRGAMVSHMSTHKIAERTECDICGKLVLCLRGHKKNVHSKVPEVNCPICQKSVKKLRLKSHMTMFHNEEGYKCKECDKDFRSKKALKDHMDLHEGKTYKCHFCPHVNVNSGNLIKHQKQAHYQEYMEWRANRNNVEKIRVAS